MVPQGGLFWDGRANTLQKQALVPLLDPHEMDGGSIDERGRETAPRALCGALRAAVRRRPFSTLRSSLVAEAMFAVARYQIEEPSFHPYTSKYDYWLEGKARFSAAEARGYMLFNDPDKANCGGCHLDRPGADGLPPLFTDHQFEALGAPRNAALADNRDPRYFDLGVCGPIRTDMPTQTQYCGMFLTPTLRNIATRHAFFHNGVFHTLQQVLDFYNFRDTNPEKVYPRAADGTVAEIQRHSGAISGQCRRERSALRPPSRRHAGDDGAGGSRHHRVPEDADGRIQAGPLRGRRTRQCASGARHVLARQNGPGRKQPLAAGASTFVVVEELKSAFAQLHDRDVGGRADIERAAVVEDGEHARGIHGGARDDLVSGMPNVMNFDMTFGRSTTPVVSTFAFQSVENVSGQKPCLMAFRRSPSRNVGDAIAKSTDAPAARRQ